MREPGMIVIPPSERNRPPQKPKRPAQAAEAIELSDEDLIEEKPLVSGVRSMPKHRYTEEPEALGAEDVIEIREPGEFQEQDVVPAFEVNGFKGLSVVATLEKYDTNKLNPEKRNQDNIIADPETGLIGVLDGLGGEGKGDLASKSAEQSIPETYKQVLLERPKNLGEVQDEFIAMQLRKLGAANLETATAQRAQITRMAEEMIAKYPAMTRKALALMEAVVRSNEAVKESGGKTTACVGFVHTGPDGSRWAVVANVGDSAAYKRRANGEMIPLTKEDSLLNRMIDSGEMSPELLAQMKAEPDKKFPIPVTLDLIRAAGGTEKDYEKAKGNQLPMSYKKLKVSMVGALGGANPEPSLAIRKLEKGDELILGTDGLVDKFEDPTTEETNLAELAQSASTGKTQIDRVNALRTSAKSRTTYKKDDDIAIISVKVT